MQKMFYVLILLKSHPRMLIPELCRQMYSLGWVTGTGGGISIRLGRVLFNFLLWMNLPLHLFDHQQLWNALRSCNDIILSTIRWGFDNFVLVKSCWASSLDYSSCKMFMLILLQWWYLYCSIWCSEGKN